MKEHIITMGKQLLITGTKGLVRQIQKRNGIVWRSSGYSIPNLSVNWKLKNQQEVTTIQKEYFRVQYTNITIKDMF